MKSHKKMQRPPQSSQSGFTLIESLLAILVVTILLVGLTPFFALAVANRVQAKRVELATQAARTYIDGVKSGDIIPPPMMSSYTLDQFPVPTQTALNCTNANDYCPTQSPTTTQPNSQTVYYCVPGEGHSTCTINNFTDMILQVFGYISPTTSTNVASGYRSYRLGVRVYRADAFDPSNPRTFSAGSTQSSFTGGTGLGKAQAPLVEMTTEMSVSDPTQFQYLCTSAGVKGC